MSEEQKQYDVNDEVENLKIGYELLQNDLSSQVERLKTFLKLARYWTKMQKVSKVFNSTEQKCEKSQKFSVVLNKTID